MRGILFKLCKGTLIFHKLRCVDFTITIRKLHYVGTVGYVREIKIQGVQTF